MTTRGCPFIALLLVLSCAGAVQGHDASGPAGTVSVDWRPEHVQRVTSAGYGDSFGLETSSKKGFPNVVTIGDRRCVEGSFFLFDVADDWAFDIDETVELEIVFDRRRSNGVLVSYDRNGVAEPVQRIEFEASDDAWHRERVRLERARFANRGQTGADFALGGLSAFWPGIPDDDHTIAICELKITRSHETRKPAGFGRLELTILDAATGRPTPARLGIYDSTGRMPLPGEDALPLRNYADRVRQIFLRSGYEVKIPWPAENRYAFYSSGKYRARLPADEYQLVVAKGIEYAVVKQPFRIAPGETVNLAVELARWASMAAEGWYSGDAHIHLSRTPADDREILTFLQGEDLRVSNLLQMGNPASTYFRQYAWGRAGRYIVDAHALVPGVEDPRTALLGHTIGLNVQEPVRNPSTYLQYAPVFDAHRAQGALSGYAHVAGNQFHADRGLALEVPLGAVDFIEVMQAGALASELWYEFLDLGFKLIPAAGSDFPYLGHPGAERSYARLKGGFSTDAWYDALRAEHTFVTNGPLLELDVAGQSMGSTVSVVPGERIKVRASARLNPDLDSLDRLELVVHGEVVAFTPGGANTDSIVLEHEIEVNEGFWVAARAFGRSYAMAHTAPVYVVTDAKSGFWAPEKAPALIARMRERLSQLDLQLLSLQKHEELEPWEVEARLLDQWKEQRTYFEDRIRRAERAYGALLRRALAVKEAKDVKEQKAR